MVHYAHEVGFLDNQVDWSLLWVSEEGYKHVSLPKRIHTQTCTIVCKCTLTHTDSLSHSSSHGEGFRFEARSGLASLRPHITSSTHSSPFPSPPSLHQSVTLPHAASSLARGEPRGAPSVWCRGAGTKRSVTPFGTKSPPLISLPSLIRIFSQGAQGVMLG